VTAQALMAFERRPLPIAAVPRKHRKRSKPKPAAAAPAPAAPAEKPKAAPQASPEESGGQGIVPAPKTPAAAEDALQVDRSGGADKGDDSGLPAWAFVIAGLGALAVVLAFRRKLGPALWHSQRRDA